MQKEKAEGEGQTQEGTGESDGIMNVKGQERTKKRVYKIDGLDDAEPRGQVVEILRGKLQEQEDRRVTKQEGSLA